MRDVGTVTACPRDRGPAAQPEKMQTPETGEQGWRARASFLGMVTGAFLRRKDRARGETDAERG